MTVYFIPSNATWNDLILNDNDPDPDPCVVNLLFKWLFKSSPGRRTKRFYNSIVPDHIIDLVYSANGGVVVRT